MAKNPVLPLYYNDILGATKTWTDEEFGAYIRLLIEQWDKGGLPKDYQRLARLATSLDANWPMLKDKFEEVAGLLKNKRMEEIREEKARHAQKQKENAERRYQKAAKLPAKTDAKNMPLEGEGEIEIEDKIKRALDEIYLDGQRPKWQHIEFDFEVNAFCEKVRGSPSHYAGHDADGLRLAFQAQLRGAKKKQQNGSKQTTNTNALVTAHQQRWGK